MRKILLICFGLFLVWFFGFPKMEKMSEKQKLANEIRKKVATQLARERNLVPFGTTGQMMDEIKVLGLSFFYRKPVNIEESRELLITAVEAMLNEINTNEKIRPYLNNFPFESKNIHILISLKNPDGSEVDPGKLCIIKASRGILRYRIEDANDRLVDLHRETYEEALQKLGKNQSERLKQNTSVERKQAV